MKNAKIYLRLKHARQKLHETVSEIISYVEKLKTQLSKHRSHDHNRNEE